MMMQNHHFPTAPLWVTILAAACFALCFSLIQATSSSQCEMYIANSTIPNAGLGLFTAIARREATALYTGGDICIPILEMDFHHKDTFNPFHHHLWSGRVYNMKMLVRSDDGVAAMCPGFEAAINSHLSVLNLGSGYGVYDEVDMHRAKHPGAGANSPFGVSPTCEIDRDIPAGGELFKYYGDKWYQSRDDFKDETLLMHTTQANDLLEKFKRLFRGKVLSVGAPKDLYMGVMLAMQSAWKAPMINALPRDYDDAMLAMYTDISTVHIPSTTRSIEWLQQHGKCVDHIVPKPSTLPGAGKGAFAKRDLTKNTIITGSPILAIPFQDTFIGMREVFREAEPTWSGKPMQQILVNYCFGHAESTMLLCPYGSGISYINHNKTLANVKVVWAEHGTTAQNDEWFTKTPRDFEGNFGAKLGMDYVALRDIEKGEELFMDYGDAWEEAWTKHTEAWHEHNNDKEGDDKAASYKSAFQFNKEKQGQPLRTIDEQRQNRYPENLQMRCHRALVEEETFQKMGKKFVWTSYDYGYECRIMDRTPTGSGEYEYTIMLKTEPKYGEDPSGFEEEILGFAQIPRMAIKFFNLPYTTDLYLKNAFRQEIGLPDELMQDAWRNIGQRSAYVKETPAPFKKAAATTKKSSKQQATRHRGLYSGGTRTLSDEL